MITFDDLNKSYLPSSRLWKGFAPPESFGPMGTTCISHSGNPAFGFFDNFHSHHLTTLEGPYAKTVIAISTILQIADTATEKGLLSFFLPGDTAEDEAFLKWGGTLTAPFRLSGQDLVFECRISLSAITAAKWNFGVGLGHPDMHVTDLFFTDSDALADKNFVGFVHLAPEGADIDGAYKAAGETYQDGAVKTKLDALHTAVATTYVKLGFRYRAHPKKLEFYVDGVLVGGNITPARLTAADIDAATFPDEDADFLAPVIGIKDSAGDTALTMNLDWWGCAQLLA